MWEAAWQGLIGILQPQMLGLMVTGVVLGSIVAALPGIGGAVLISISLPFAITLSPMACIAFLLGIGAITNTANTFPSVLMAVPGSAGSQATILDGYPMAQKGQAARAFGAAYTVSAMGGLFGALVLTVSLPILRPLVLSFASPEFFVLCLWGVSMVGVLSGRRPLKGIAVGMLGIFTAMVGLDPKSGTARFVFDQPYLWDGISIMIVALGMFAIPETIAMVRRATSIAQMEYGGGLAEGVRDAFRHWFLMLRCAAIGVWVGFIPGLGSAVADWFAYAHAIQTEKNTESFGKGDVRGVIAPESANNAKEGGALIPTLAFGIPGSTSMALTLIAFLAVGIDPGPKMLTGQLDLVFAMIWVLVISNLMATALCLALGKPMARISFMPYYIVAPMVIILCFMAAFAANFDQMDLVSLFVVSVIGYFMKKLDWPRPPMIIGVVLGEKMERYLWISSARYGTSWLLHPAVIVLLALVVISVVIVPILQQRRQRKKIALVRRPGLKFRPRSLFTVLMGLVFLSAIISARDWPLNASILIFVLGGGVALPLIIVQLFMELRPAVADLNPGSGMDVPLFKEGERFRDLKTWGWLFGLLFTIWLIGFMAAVPIFVFAFSIRYGARWYISVFLAALAAGLLFGLFDMVVHVSWPEPFILNLLN